eukprot:XP_001690474.1 predicted protein [Chlamydomonas reinhardtii]
MVGRIEALTKALTTLKKQVGRVKTEVEIEEERDGFAGVSAKKGKTTDVLIGGAKEKVYDSITGRDSGEALWRSKSVKDIGYQEFLAEREADDGEDDDDGGFGRQRSQAPAAAAGGPRRNNRRASVTAYTVNLSALAASPSPSGAQGGSRPSAPGGTASSGTGTPTGGTVASPSGGGGAAMSASMYKRISAGAAGSASGDASPAAGLRLPSLRPMSGTLSLISATGAAAARTVAAVAAARAVSKEPHPPPGAAAAGVSRRASLVMLAAANASAAGIGAAASVGSGAVGGGRSRRVSFAGAASTSGHSHAHVSGAASASSGHAYLVHGGGGAFLRQGLDESAEQSEAINLELMEGSGRWFDAGDLSYCDAEAEEISNMLAGMLTQPPEAAPAADGSGSSCRSSTHLPAAEDGGGTRHAAK